MAKSAPRMPLSASKCRALRGSRPNLSIKEWSHSQFRVKEVSPYVVSTVELREQREAASELPRKRLHSRGRGFWEVSNRCREGGCPRRRAQSRTAPSGALLGSEVTPPATGEGRQDGSCATAAFDCAEPARANGFV